MDRKQNTLCKLHTLRAIQIGCCITCNSSSPICETKGCIKHHAEPQKFHTSYTVKEAQRIAEQYITSNEQKRNILKKLVTEYFKLLKSEIESLYHEITHTLNNLKFQNFLMNDDERKLADLLVGKRYSELSCRDVALILPKMQKCASFEEKQFNHLKDFLYNEKQNMSKMVNSMILNLPYFRDDQNIIARQKFSEISDELLSNVNAKLQALTYHPKKLRIKYSKFEVMQVTMRQLVGNQESIAVEQRCSDLEQKFIKILENLQTLKEVEELDFYCTWNVSEEDFQIEFFDAAFSLPFLTNFKFTTAYKVTTTEFIEELVENKNIEFKIIIKPDWHF